MLKIALVLLLTLAVSGFARELHFDPQGNLIDPKLDKLYAVTRHYSYLVTTAGHSPLYEVTLFDITTKWRFNIGAAYKFVYTDLNWSIKSRVLGIGLVTGYSFKKHRPAIGVAFTLRWF